MTHTVFSSTNMASTKYAERIFDCVCDQDIDNGTFGYMEKLVDRNIYKFVKGTKAGEKVLVLLLLMKMLVLSALVVGNFL